MRHSAGADCPTRRCAWPRNLGLNPRTLIKNIPSSTQRWKAPVEEWVRDLYRRRFGGTPRHRKATSSPDDGANASGQPRTALRARANSSEAGEAGSVLPPYRCSGEASRGSQTSSSDTQERIEPAQS